MDFDLFIKTTLYFLALINPASKVFILSTMQPAYTKTELLKVSAKASFVALIILLVISAAGLVVLHSIFQVDVYSLRVAGGIILFIIGLTAVRKGRFYEQNIQDAMANDISIVPLAAPLIAGPGTITAAISYSSEHNMMLTMVALTAAVAINFVIMLSSVWIGKLLEKIHAFGPLIRITGLIVAAVSVQMILSGISEWLIQTLSSIKP
jgi:multiple antibiotic resistance protein